MKKPVPFKKILKKKYAIPLTYIRHVEKYLMRLHDSVINLNKFWIEGRSSVRRNLRQYGGCK